MSMIKDEVYDRFKSALEAVAGKCYRTSKADLAKTVVKALKDDYGYTDACLAETPLLKEAGVGKAMEEAGIKTYTDHIRLNQETAKGGVTESQYAIADLGSIVQTGTDVDRRIVACLSELMVCVVKGSNVISEWSDFFYTIGALPEHPNFIGIVTGPSRTSDIEMVSVVGVHGPLNLTAIVVEDE